MNRITPHSATVWGSENHSAASKDTNSKYATINLEVSLASL